MLIPSYGTSALSNWTSLSRRVNANSQLRARRVDGVSKLIKKGEC